MLNEVFLQKLTNEKNRRKTERDHYDWTLTARENQKIPEGTWQNWLILAGRGFGKTRTGAETIRHMVSSGLYKRIALIGGSVEEVLNVMVNGNSGIMTVTPKRERPRYQSRTQTLIWPNQAQAQIFGSHHPEKLRGPQFDAAWIDELAKFRLANEIWDQLQLGLRLGENPKCLITTTPRTIPLIQTLIKDPHTVITKGTTFDNAANLATSYIDQIKRQFTGTRLGAQELYAEILTETQGALWQRDMIRYKTHDADFVRIVVAIDPAATHHEKSDETGIVVAGLSEDGNVYVLEDLSGRHSPNDWGKAAVEAYYRHQCDRIVAEINKGGDMVERVIRSVDMKVAFKAVRATRGKATRAEPIAALYEQGKVFHNLPLTYLEKQLCDYIPHQTSKSPDRLDALVWAITELVLEKESNPTLKIW
jgi:predicted phage terminase large subunit-like protein